jgi:two-component system, OmpR family, sensor histidine kinase KdpD
LARVGSKRDRRSHEIMQSLLREMRQAIRTADGRGADAMQIAKTLAVPMALVAAMTACLLVVTYFLPLRHISSAYLIPVIVAAIRFGIAPAILTAIGGVGASAFFFYEPIYDFRVADPGQLLDLPLFILVAMVTGELAARVRRHSDRARERESEMRALYAFSRRLAVATDAPQIYSAIQDHVSSVTGYRVYYFDTKAKNARAGAVEHAADGVPEPVVRAVEEAMTGNTMPVNRSIHDPAANHTWLVCPVSKTAAFGLLAIDLGRALDRQHTHVRQGIETALADASATLDRLDVARVIGEAKLRAEAETLRSALMGSVSHGLRTPLASIVGSASILIEAPSVKAEGRLAALVNIVHDEAQRLDGDIQKLLDASRISSAGVSVHLTWADPGDIINAAVASQHRALAGHQVKVHLSDDLPLAHVDPLLIEQALGQVLDNAAKYSPAGSPIQIEAGGTADQVVITVSDEGAGLTTEDRQRMFERFHRGARTRDTTGSGLGLWIARAFVVACGGTLEAESAGVGRGTRMSIALPGSALPKADTSGDTDD